MYVPVRASVTTCVRAQYSSMTYIYLSLNQSVLYLYAEGEGEKIRGSSEFS